MKAILEIDMPDNCMTCFLAYWVNDNKKLCFPTGKICIDRIRPLHCPLKPAKE